VNKDDVDRSKPEPDIFRAALDATGLDPANAIVVGDSVWDVKAAEPLGLRVAGVLSGGVSRYELEEAGVVAVCDEVAQILGDLDRTPIGRLLQAPTDR